MLRADRNAAILAGLICAAAGIKGKDGKILTATEFDIFNRGEEKDLTVDDFMRVLARKT